MGLIKTGIKYGALFGVAHEAGKVLSSHQQNNNNQQQQYPPQNNYYPQQSRGMPSQQGGFTDANGYLHQSYCNGQCGMQCNGTGAAQRNYQHRDYCNGGCKGTCNGKAIDNGEAAEYYGQQSRALPPAPRQQGFVEEGPAPTYEESISSSSVGGRREKS